MIWTALLDIIGAAGCCAALAAVFWMSSRRIGGVAKCFLVVTLLYYLFISGANALEHLDVTTVLDPYEDYAEILFFPFALFFLYAVWVKRELSRRTQAEQRAEHLNTVLRSIQQVNALIVRAQDRDELLRRCCRVLVEARGFSGAWGVLLDRNRQVQTVAEAGASEGLRRVSEALQQGALPRYVQAALSGRSVVRVPFEELLPGRAATADGSGGGLTLVARIGHGDSAYGVLAVCHDDSAPVAVDAEAQLIGELADDLGLAVHNLALEVQKDEAEAQFRQAQKMEAVARLAGGVAHDLRNQLTVINGYSDLLFPEAPKEGLWHEGLTEIRKAALSAEETVRHLLAFSRRQELHPEVINVGDLLTDLEKPIFRTIREDIELSVTSAEDVGNVEVDRGQMDQSMINLVINARDAMPHGGKLTIEAMNLDLDASYEEVHSEMKPGPCVMIAVCDTGTGMDKETRERCFDPFFTTKETGKGTGLGLSMVHGFIRQSGGAIYVYSEPGHGTTFRVYLPRADRPVVPHPAVRAEPRPGGSETILVVEDEESVRRLAVAVLTRCGYTALEAANAREATALAHSSEKPVDLLLTDVVMPSVSGPELARQLVAEQPGLKVLYMSGYAGNAVDRHMLGGHAAELLAKPFSPDQLARIVRRTLDGGAGVS